MTDKLRGRIKSIKKNYGFIGGQNNVDYFFHWTFLAKECKTFNQLAIGNTVEFIPEKVGEQQRAREVISLD